MRTRRLGNSDLDLTVLGLGTWAIGGTDWKFGWGPSDDEQAVAALVHGVRSGINWIDTAAVYGRGHSEELVGLALKELGPGARPIVATKCTRIVQDDGVPKGCMERDSIVAECEASLRRLGVEAIDLYQLHWPDPDERIEEGWAALGELIEAGKVRYAGVSNFAVSQLERVHAERPVTSLQPPYSMLRRGVEAEILPWCAEHGVGVVAYSPMQKGLLSGRFTAERAAALTDDDHRSRDPEFQGPKLEANLRIVEGLRTIALDHRCSIAELAIAWTLRHEAVTSAIVGVRRVEQVGGLLGASQVELGSGALAAIEELLGR